MKTREAIQNFLSNREADSPHLIPKWSVDLETQVMTTTDGQLLDDRPGVYTDNGKEEWKNIRWPYQAGTDPQYTDPTLKFSPEKRVERVGTTWWNWVEKKSIGIGIDIDYQEGHAATTTTNSDDEIENIVNKLKGLEYVTIVRSTGGKGLHVYVFFENCPESRNHHEHTIVARKTLELISQDIGYDLKSHVDCVGAVFWIWSKSSPADHPGFSMVKEGTYLDASRLAAINLPTPSVRGSNPTDFELVELSEAHKRILEAVSRQPFYFNYRPDLNLVHTHTCAIKAAVEDLAAAGEPIHGTFVTSSSASDPMTANCFMAPQADGSFRVIRFGQAQHEPSWEFKNGKNYCPLNESVSYQEVLSGLGTFKAGKYSLEEAAVRELAESLGEPIVGNVPNDVWAVLIDSGIELYSKVAADGWVPAGDKKYKKVLTVDQPVTTFRTRILRRADDQIRFVTVDGSIRGWYSKTESGEWLLHKHFSDINCIARGIFGEFVEQAHKIMMESPWNMVKIPFESEYPGNRRWNYNAPQLAVEPTESGGDHPHFDLILNHIGDDLNIAVEANDWCRKAGIFTGADYLRTWLACLIHHTQQPLPYLFLSGPQNSGKSIFHEAAKLLFTAGITSANSAITSSHNGELAGCFLVYIEEKDLADKRHNAYERIKEWTTGRDLMVHEKYMTPYMTPNYLHFVQMANSTGHLPLDDGDTRIVAIDVPALKKPVPKAILEKALLEEAPRFVRTLLNTIVSPPVDRLRIPALRTRTKELMERRAMTTLMAFASENLFPASGYKVSIPEFIEAYKSYCQSHGREPDPDFLIQQEIITRSDRFTVGSKSKIPYLLNVSLVAGQPAKEPLVTNSTGHF